MFGQTVVDNQYSATYVEDYFDCVENFPEDVQRHISHCHELDISYRSFLKDVNQYREQLENNRLDPATERKILCKLDQALIALQEVGDEKVEISQQILDLADNKYRQLDQDFRNLDFSKEDSSETSYHSKENPTRELTRESSSRGGGEERVSLSNANNGTENRHNKRPRRGRTDNVAETETNNPPVESTASVTRSAKRQNSSGNKKKKRKSTRNTQQQDSPPREEELQPEIDEPTYCLCDQISYGEMILCDNDLCPIEWFHFVCVALASKPKGKWFCPKCRGDRPNVMKPKGQFLKELEKYNKEKEEKG